MLSLLMEKVLNLATGSKNCELKYDSTENAKYDNRLKSNVLMTLSSGEITHVHLSHYKIWKKKNY